MRTLAFLIAAVPLLGALPLLGAFPLLGALPAAAQIKPHSSGQTSFNAPQMRRHGSGLHRPNRPHHHHHHGFRHHLFY